MKILEFMWEAPVESVLSIIAVLTVAIVAFQAFNPENIRKRELISQAEYKISQENWVEFTVRQKFFNEHCTLSKHKKTDTCDKIYAWVMSASGINYTLPFTNQPNPMLKYHHDGGSN